MITVHKIPLTLDKNQRVPMPKQALILTVALQQGAPCVWFRCDDQEQPLSRTIHCCGTGHLAPLGRHIGTVVLQDSTVWHYFETFGRGL